VRRCDGLLRPFQVSYFSSANTTSNSATSALSDEGQQLCSAFAWADVGIMGGLWLILLIVQGYFLVYVLILYFHLSEPVKAGA
jgi:hypothetical protein